MIFIQLIKELRATNSTNNKKDVLLKYNSEYIRKCLYYILNPFYKYNVTKQGLLNYLAVGYNENEGENIYADEIFMLLDDLRSRTITGHTALNAISSFYINNSDENRQILLSALDKDLDCGTGISLVNKALSDGSLLIPEFNVTRAYKIQDVLKKEEDTLDYKNNHYRASRKLDGIRCIAIYENKELKFYSREGNEFLSLDKVKESLLPQIEELGYEEMVLDGELCIIDENGNEDFKQIIKEFRKKDHTIERPYYVIFDIIPLNEFYNGEGPSIFSERYDELLSISKELTTEYSGVLDYSDILHSDKDLDKYNSLAKENNWEGIILRNVKAPYQGKRTKNLLKVKKFSDAEFEVVGIETGKQGVLEGGIIVDKDIMARLNIEYKGNIVGVGTGFSLEERLHYFHHPKDIVGKMITVQYMEESVDKNGIPSLRHPSFKGIRDYE